MGIEAFGDHPFTAAHARDAGLTDWDLRALCEAGRLRRVQRNAYVDSSVPDSLALRCATVRLLVSPDVVITDWTAAWVHGADGVLPPNADLRTPAVKAFHRSRGGRVKRREIASGQRMMPDSDVVELHGLVVTTRLRTAVDLGRQRNRFKALGGIDVMLRLGVPHDHLLGSVERFRGYRGVRNLRTLAPLGDARSESPGESALRLHWYDAGLPRPRCQVPVDTPWGTYYLDIGHEDSMLAAEYDGEAFHGEDDEEHDDERRGRAEGQGWTIAVARRKHVWGPERCADQMLRAAAEDAVKKNRRRRGRLDAPYPSVGVPWASALVPGKAASESGRAASRPGSAASR